MKRFGNLESNAFKILLSVALAVGLCPGTALANTNDQENTDAQTPIQQEQLIQLEQDSAQLAETNSDSDSSEIVQLDDSELSVLNDFKQVGDGDNLADESYAELASNSLSSGSSVSARVYDGKTVQYKFTLSNNAIVVLGINVKATMSNGASESGSMALTDDKGTNWDVWVTGTSTSETASYVLPAGTYTISFTSVNRCNSGRTLTLQYSSSYSTGKYSLSGYQIAQKQNRTIDDAAQLTTDGNLFLGSFYFGYGKTKFGEYIDGHWFKFSIDRKSTVSVTFSNKGNSAIGLYDGNGNPIKNSSNNSIVAGTTSSKQSVIMNCETLDAGTYYLFCTNLNSNAWNTPFAGSVTATPCSQDTPESTLIDISTATVSSIADQTYTGSEICPSLTVKANGKTLVEGTDYTVSYANNVNVGTATATIEGIGSYTGTKAVPFKVVEPTTDPTPEPTVTKVVAPAAATGLSYTGSEQIGVADGEGYTLSGTTKATAAGSYIATATLKDGFAWSNGGTDAKTIKWSIARAGISSGEAKISDSAVYMGHAVEPSVSVTLGDKMLTAGTDYTVSYSNNDGFGTGKATVTGKGNYTGTLTTDFEIDSKVVNVFSDASYGDWYVDSGALDYAYAHGLISGYSGTDLVGAYDSIKRQDVAVILWRMAGEPEVAAGDSFEDVDYDDYYGSAVRWARETGVINGYQDADGVYRTFGPNDLVTREQLAAMIANYAEKIGGQSVTSNCTKLDSLPDANDVSSWARTSMGWCMDNGIMNGVYTNNSTYAQPSGNAWRASMASMAAVLHRDVLKLG